MDLWKLFFMDFLQSQMISLSKVLVTGPKVSFSNIMVAYPPTTNAFIALVPSKDCSNKYNFTKVRAKTRPEVIPFTSGGRNVCACDIQEPVPNC